MYYLMIEGDFPFRLEVAFGYHYRVDRYLCRTESFSLHMHMRMDDVYLHPMKSASDHDPSGTGEMV